MSRFFGQWRPEIHTNRQVTQHGCLPNLLGDRDKGIYIVYGEEKYFVLCRLEQPRLNKNLSYRHDKPNEPTMKGPLSFVLFKSPFISQF
jgi:hypothetical protein